MSELHVLLELFEEAERELAAAVRRDAGMAEIRDIDARLVAAATAISRHKPQLAADWQRKFDFFLSMARRQAGEHASLEELSEIFRGVLAQAACEYGSKALRLDIVNT